MHACEYSKMVLWCYFPQKIAHKKFQVSNFFGVTSNSCFYVGGWKDVTWPDDWTAVTKDGRRSAQFEHTVLVTETGVDILTARTKDSVPFWWEETEEEKELV